MLRSYLFFSHVVISVLLFSLPLVGCGSESKNGFDLSGSAVPVHEILSGGPPRDGIPAIDEPRFMPVNKVRWLQDGDRVLGIDYGGQAKAYPIAILNWHEVVNDRIGQESVVVTFCPLCGTGMAFKARVAGEVKRFGVSGLLYNSDVLLYDRETESLWSQIARQAISGPLKGQRLEMIVVNHTTWQDWRNRYPDSLVLARETGYQRDYGQDPYSGYKESTAVFFPVAHTDARYHPKEQVIGLALQGHSKAYPFVELAQSKTPLRDQLAGQQITLEYDMNHRTGRVLGADGVEIPSVIAFWFAWVAFHPDSQIYSATD
jgi:hypothetical protein